MDQLCFAYDVGLAAETDHFVRLVLQFEQSRCTLVVLGMIGAACTRKSVVLSIRFSVHVGAIALQSSLVFRIHLRFDLVQTGPENGNVRALFEIRPVDVGVHEILVDFQHPKLSVLQDDVTKLNG